MTKPVRPPIPAVLLSFLAISSSGVAMELHVSLNGKDANPGTEAAPLASLAGARDAIRAVKAKEGLPAEGITVFVHAGVYPQAQSFALEAQDSGAENAPIVYRAAPGEEVRITGGRRVPAGMFQPVGATVRGRLPAASRAHVICADLKSLGVTALGQFPVRFRGAPLAPELFCDDRRMTLARWPNTGWTTIARIIDSGSRPRDGDGSNRPGVFEYSGDNPSRWNVATGVWLQGFWCYDWYEETIRVQSIDTEKRQITLAQPHLYSVKQGNPSPRRYRALNLLEELDEPGEYYIDRETSRLYFWPPHDPKQARIVLSTLHAPVIVLRDAECVTLRGFIVETGLTHGIQVIGGRENSILACHVRNMREQGIRIDGGQRHRVEACDIHDTGTGGLYIAGGDRKTLTPAGHEAVNNHIWNFSRHQLTYANGLMLAGVGNRGAHNLIHDAPHQGIGISGNDHLFEFNIVHHVCMASDDCGALYKGRNPSMRGNVIRYNFWHNIGSPMGHGNAAIYFDDGDGGETVLGNIFFRCGEPGRGSFGTVFSHGGHDNTAQNNIFIECKRALGSAPWNDKRWKAMVNGKLWQERLLKEVDITKPPYTTHYPALVGFMNPQPGQERVNRARRNLLVMCAEVKSGNWQVDPQENWVTDHDPGFVDAAGGDFRLRPDAEAFRKLPGFKPLPFAKMGLVTSDLRPTLPRDSWDYPPPRPLPPLTAKRAAPAKPKGPPPVFKVPPKTTDIQVDGAIQPSEWNGARRDQAMALTQRVDGTKAPRPSWAWLQYDDEALYLAVDSEVQADTRLDGNRWGADDAIEVSIRPQKTGSPIHVLRGYGNGKATYGKTPDGDTEPAAGQLDDIRYAVRRVSATHWTAEIRIPWRRMGWSAPPPGRVPFNLTVRKARDDVWLMWEGTRWHSYDVDKAGLLLFAPR